MQANVITFVFFFADLPRGRIGQVDIADSGLQYVNAEPLSASKIESLRLMNNKIQYIDDKAFR